MSYVRESLSEGEEIEEFFRFHWFAWLWFILWVLLSPITFGVTLLFALYEFLRLKCTEHGLTNKRVVLKTGIISRRSEEMKLKSIETVEIDQGVFGRILGFGTVRTTGRGISDVCFRLINDPMSVKRAIESVSNPID